MKTKFFAVHIMLGLLSLVILFHLLIIAGIIPYDITWGGKLKNDTEMYMFESVSIVLNIFLIWIILMKVQYVTFRFHKKVLNCLLWFFLILFIVNTIGNLFASTTFEKMLSILTFAFSILILIILRFGRIAEPENP